jgi:hypothetical protein
MPKPAPYDFSIYQARTFRKRWRHAHKEPDGSVGAAIDLTGYHARLVVPASATEDFIHLTDVDAESFPAGTWIHLGGIEGTIEWYMPDEVTADLDFTEVGYHFDLQDTLGDWIPVLRGKARLWKVR